MSLSLVLADNTSTVYHEFARLQALSQWWHWLVLFLVCGLVVGYIVVAYYYDSLELPLAKRIVLLSLRLMAFAAVLFFFLDLEKRSQREVLKNSRALLLVDTSLSMGIQDQGSESSAPNLRRIDAIVDELAQGDLIERLRQRHDVVVYRFDQSAVPAEVASFPKTELASAQNAAGLTADEQFNAALAEARVTAAVAGVALALALVAFCYHVVSSWWRSESEASWGVLVAMVSLIVSVVVLGVANLRHPDIGLLATIGLAAPDPPTPASRSVDPDQLGVVPASIDWPTELTPQGAETRLGDALRFLINREREGSAAGIVVVTDGGSNAGVQCQQSIAAAHGAGIPLFAIGLGGIERPVNVRVVDVEAPQRVYPGDSFTLNGYLQAYGLSGRKVTVELVSRSTDAPSDQPGDFEEDRTVNLGADGEMLPVRFVVTPTQQGTRVYSLRVKPPRQDHDPRDNQRTAKVQVIERKNQVLLFAGGPAREFRFLRNLLYRDRDAKVHVHLQTGTAGISQEADQVLYEFPATADELFEYDCIVAFDPDWLALDESQVQLLERWVAEKAGGLIVVAGPVHTPGWTSRVRTDARLTTIKSLYPVVFYSSGSATLSLGRFAAETAWPLEFTRDGEDAEFLWLEDDLLLSQQAWASFAGVYGYYAVKDPKPGARVYARFSDPNTSMDGDLPIYLAGHFYGAGRVFFQASGEIWRVRAIDDSYFERYYTKLVRWVSQGRLLRDSNRGVLLVDKARCLLGDHVGLRAVLNDAQHEPLTAAQVAAVLVHPDGRRTTLELRRAPQAAREGMYEGQFTAGAEGDYRVELRPPHAAEGELLTREVRARIPELETERPQRNDPLLKQMAEKTGGEYYVGLNAALNRDGASRTPVANLLEPRDQVTYVAGAPDKVFDQLLMTWLMGIICGALSLEWLIRRLSKLA